MRPGTWTAYFPVRITNATDDVIIPAGTYGPEPLRTVNNGLPSLEFYCPANNDPDNSATRLWKVTIVVTFSDGARAETFVLDVPTEFAASGINLRSLTAMEHTGPAPVPVVPDASDPGTFYGPQSPQFGEDPADPGTYLIGA